MAEFASPVSQTRVSGGIAGLRRYSTLFAVALVAFGLGEVGLFLYQRSITQWADHSRDVARLARSAYRQVLERRAAANVYLLSSGRTVPVTARIAAAITDSSLDSLARLTADNPGQTSRARAIARAFQDWNTQFAAPALAGALSPAAAANLDPPLFTPVRTAFAAFLTAEDVLYDGRHGRSQLMGWLALLGMLVPSGLLAGLVVASGRRFAGQADQLAAQQETLEEQAMELEQQVEELEVSNTELGEALDAVRQARDRAESESYARQRNAALLSAALVSSPIGLSLLDCDLRYIQVNRAIAAVTGLAADDHVGRTLREVNPRLSPDIEALLLRVLETDEPLQNLEMMRPGATPDAPMRYLLLNVYPMKSETGETLGLAVAALDTTDQRALQEQFHHAQKLEAVGRLAAGIAHDFNNLLTVVRSYCDLALLEMADDAPGREEIGEIRAAGERAAALSRQMLAMSRKQAIIPRPVATGEVMAELEPMLRRVTANSVRFDMTLERPLGIVRIDPTHLEQVLMNLVINAVDATPPDGRVAVEARNVVLDEADVKRLSGLAAGAHVAITVSDTGSGIDAETLQRIFEPFFTTKGHGKGTGLGLSTVYGIVREAGGYVRVESTVGQGTAFTVYLPAELPEAGAGPREAPRGGGAGVPAGARGDEVVLLVEDEELLRKSLLRALKRRGYTVVEAAHGGEALRLAQEYQGSIHLVLSDLHMPGMNGRDLVARLAADRPQLRVLFMSGSSGGES
ncbi:MAG TPA: ATP-binding protein, partial [Gemmatimonadaceae bacterium]|nr:ATP-binding protein [Gemmatimonadaceae bacterium]